MQVHVPTHHPPTVVHIGAFDLASYGDQIFPLVAAHELRRRIGDVELLPFAPIGSIGDGRGANSWTLGPWTAGRAAELAGRATLVLCGGGEIVLGDGSVYAPFYGIDHADAAGLRIDRWFIEVLAEAEAGCPVVWHSPGVPVDLDPDTAARVRSALAGRALVTVRDDASRSRLVAAGVEREVEVVPDSAFLLPRVLPPERLAAHRAELRAAGLYPEEGPVVVVQGNHTMSTLAPDLARALRAQAPEARLVTVAVSPCHDDDRFAAELAAAVDGPTWSVPGDSPLEAVAAAIAGADCFVGVSLHGAITARAYGRPHVTYDPFGQAKLSGFADLIDAQDGRAGEPGAAAAIVRTRLGDGAAATPGTGAIDARIDEHFDRVAELVEHRAESTATEPMTWADTPTPLHLVLRRPPRPVAPVAGTEVAGLRRPDVTPTPDELRATVAAALRARAAQRDAAASDHAELVRLRGENRDLRGALAHLEGTQARADELEASSGTVERELREATEACARLTAALEAARASRIFRLTGRPAALRSATGTTHGNGA
jgi:lipopolysaccharide transport system ATP-binding protein